MGTVHTASVAASGGKRYRPKVLRKASVLPIKFLGGGGGRVGGDRGFGGGLDSVIGGVRGVAGDAGGVAVGGMGGKRGGARLAHRDLATRPGTPCLDGIPGSVVFRALLLEAREHVLGAVGGPERQRPVVSLVEPHLTSLFYLSHHRWGAGQSTPAGWPTALTVPASRYRALDTKSPQNGPRSVHPGDAP